MPERTLVGCFVVSRNLGCQIVFVLLVCWQLGCSSLQTSNLQALFDQGDESSEETKTPATDLESLFLAQPDQFDHVTAETATSNGQATLTEKSAAENNGLRLQAVSEHSESDCQSSACSHGCCQSHKIKPQLPYAEPIDPPVKTFSPPRGVLHQPLSPLRPIGQKTAIDESSSNGLRSKTEPIKLVSSALQLESNRRVSAEDQIPQRFVASVHVEPDPPFAESPEPDDQVFQIASQQDDTFESLPETDNQFGAFEPMIVDLAVQPAAHHIPEPSMVNSATINSFLAIETEKKIVLPEPIIIRTVNANLPVGDAFSLPSAVDSQAGSIRHAMKLNRAQFCSKIVRFGELTPFTELKFHAAQPVLIYVEVENYQTVKLPQADGDKFLARLQGQYKILNDQNQVVQQGSFPIVDDFADQQQKDFYLFFQIAFEDLEVGQYQFQLQVEDLTGNESASIEPAVLFEIE